MVTVDVGVGAGVLVGDFRVVIDCTVFLAIVDTFISSVLVVLPSSVLESVEEPWVPVLSVDAGVSVSGFPVVDVDFCSSEASLVVLSAAEAVVAVLVVVVELDADTEVVGASVAVAVIVCIGACCGSRAPSACITLHIVEIFIFNPTIPPFSVTFTDNSLHILWNAALNVDSDI